MQGLFIISHLLFDCVVYFTLSLLCCSGIIWAKAKLFVIEHIKTSYLYTQFTINKLSVVDISHCDIISPLSHAMYVCGLELKGSDYINT